MSQTAASVTLPERSPFLRAAQGHRPRRRPVWLMRQAGRSLPEYFEARGRTTMLEACLDPALTAEITCQPVRRHGVDAAILYSDIVVPLRLAGVDVDIVPGTGPVLPSPIRTASDVDALPADPDLFSAALSPIREAVRLSAAELEQGVATPLIGFAGAPFTLASYLVEGGPSRDKLRTRALMHTEPDVWHRLMTWLADLTGTFLRAQVLAGARAVQLFDSWAGSLSRADYEHFAAPYSARAFSHVADLDVPRIHFGTSTGELLVPMKDAGATVMGVDLTVDLADADSRLGHSVPLQGNLDPALLLAGPDALFAGLDHVLAAGAAAPAHIVNLGHGVPRQADAGLITELVARVHDLPDPQGKENA